MVSSTQTVQENGGSVMVCVDSGIQGSVDFELQATLSSRIGKASKYYIYFTCNSIDLSSTYVNYHFWYILFQ